MGGQSHIRKEPTVLIHVPPHADVLAMDVHKLSISAGVLAAGAVSPVVDKIGSDEESVRRLVARVGSTIRAGCGPVMRRARRVTSWPACCGLWVCIVR